MDCSGKSMIMDLWFRSLPTPHKFRVHYHQFLLYIYGKVSVTFSSSLLYRVPLD